MSFWAVRLCQILTIHFSRYRAILPIVLLLGVQTSVDAVNVLPYALKPLLRIQTFALQSGETTLTELFQAVSRSLRQRCEGLTD